MSDIEVGDQLWFVPDRTYSGPPRFLSVVKVGRQWITFDDGNPAYRADKTTLAMDDRGHRPPGQVHRSRDEYEIAERERREWAAVQSWWRERSHYGSRPAFLTAEDVRTIARMLEVKLP